ncbi:MAG: AMP-binding protein [Chloroflexi bacterium]|nr:AMP-binding protein [Chloroflexota bacterium]
MWLIGDIARRNAQVFAAKWGVVEGDTRLTHRQVNERANSLAHGLRALGVSKGERVALLSRNDYRFVEMYFGLPKIGAIFVPLNFWSSDEDLVYVLNQCQAAALVLSAEFRETVERIRPRIPTARLLIVMADSPVSEMISYESLASGHPVHEPEADLHSDDDTLILYTSGSTGRPKGAVYTHRGLLHTAMIMSIELGLRNTEITLHFLPLFSSNLEQLLPLSLMGATHVILRKFDPSLVWETVAREKVTHFDAVPTTMRLLLQYPGLGHVDTASLRLVSYASEPMPAVTITAWLETFPRVEAVQFYGMIEFLCIAGQKPWEQLSRIGTVGRPMPGTLIRVVDEEGQDVPSGEAGEVIARSDCGMRGYWESPELTAQAIGDRPSASFGFAQDRRSGERWIVTGDLGRLDADGYLTLVGRKKEIIISGGMKVVPTETEAALYRHPAVSEAAVIGRPDATWGEAVHAVVALKPGASVTADELIQFCGQHLAGYKKPRSIEFLPSLPKTGIGKIARRALRDRFLADAETADREDFSTQMNAD